MSNFRSSFHTELSQLFYYDILYRRSNYYFLIGKTDAWNDLDSPPALPIDSLKESNIVRSNMVYAKRISPADISLVCKNWQWKLGLVFEKWDHTKDLKNSMFFCVTSDYRVYKCLDNNNGLASSVEPTGTSIAPVRLDDGYLWKYMYTIPSFKRGRFITANHIPVQRALTDNFYNRGELEAVIVTNQGDGYPDTVATTIVVDDTGVTTGSGATAGTITLGTVNQILTVPVTAAGSGYTKGVTLDITNTGGVGSGAVLSPVITYTINLNSVTGLAVNDVLVSLTNNKEYRITNITGNTVICKNDYTTNLDKTLGIPFVGEKLLEKGNLTSPEYTISSITQGIVDSVYVVSGGIGYPNTVTVTFRVGQAILIPKIDSNGSLSSVIISDAGSGYSSAPSVTLVSSSGAPSGKYGNANAILNAIVYQGKIQNVAIEDPGQNYARDTETVITVAGDGEGAFLTPVVYNNKLIDVILENPGSGYTFTIIRVIDSTEPETDKGARVRSVIESSDYESDQSIVEQTTVKGAIYSIGIEDGGNGYSQNTTISIVGDGSGATADIVVDDNGVIIRVDVTNFGSGYTYADIVINDPATEPGAGAEIYAILPPPMGHGFDAVSELYGDTLILVSSLRDELINEVIANQDYRQFAIIKNPLDQISFANFLNEKALLVYQATFASTTDLLIDEVLTQGTTKFVVVDIDGNVVYLSKITESGSLLVSSATNNTNLLVSLPDPITESVRTYECTVVSSTPSMNKYSGSLIYMSNEGPFVFSTIAGLTIKSLIKF